MTDHMQSLIDDHLSIRVVLMSFEIQLARFEKALKPDYDILHDSIAYCQDYLDHWHHPHEDALFALLKRRAPAEAKACEELEVQHADLARTSGELVRIFEAVEQDGAFLRADLVRLGRSLLHEYRKHLEWEEAHFFPAVKTWLLTEDFQAIAGQFSGSADPLAHNPVNKRFRALLAAISEA